jgi:hypothetical protein
MPVADPRIAGKPVPRISKERMERECVARVKNVEALDVAFLDQRIPQLRCKRQERLFTYRLQRPSGPRAPESSTRCATFPDCCSRNAAVKLDGIPTWR